MHQGLFVAIEGLGGLGKSTLADSLTAELVSEGYDVLRTREPGGTYAAEVLRDMLRNGKLDNHETDQKFSVMGIALLFNAARIDHVEKVIKPAIEAGKIVICDRFADSTIAIQSVEGGIDINKLVTLHNLVVNYWPDLTILIDGNAELANSRLSAEELKNDKWDRFTPDQKDCIADIHCKLAERHNHAYGRYVTISADHPKEEIHLRAMGEIEAVCEKHGLASYPIARKQLKELSAGHSPELLKILSTAQLSVTDIVEALRQYTPAAGSIS